MVTILLLLMVGNLKSISLSEVAPDNIILMQGFIKISQLFHKLLEHIQSHPPALPPHTHTRTRTRVRAKSMTKGTKIILSRRSRTAHLQKWGTVMFE